MLEYLSKYFQITVLYYNPNIYPQAEYERRLAELKNLYERFGPVFDYGVKLVEYEYEPEHAQLAGTEISETSPKWLFSDFKKKGGFKRSLELSEEYGMYRQTYCGCVYSVDKNLTTV